MIVLVNCFAIAQLHQKTSREKFSLQWAQSKLRPGFFISRGKGWKWLKVDNKATSEMERDNFTDKS